MPAAVCRKDAREFAGDIDEIVREVAALTPPKDVSDLQARFVADASKSASLLDKLADDVDAGRVTCGEPWNQRAYGLPSTIDAEQVLTEYAQRGYLFLVNSGGD